MAEYTATKNRSLFVAAVADYETRTATVTYDPSKTDIRALTEATTNAGYPSSFKSGGQQ